MAGHERQLRLRELAVDDVEVGAADAAGGDLEEHLAGLRLRLGQVLERAAARAAGGAPSRAWAHSSLGGPDDDPRSDRAGNRLVAARAARRARAAGRRLPLQARRARSRASSSGGRATFRAPPTSTSTATSPRPPGERGRHPLPDAGAFEAAARRAGIGTDTLVVAYDEAAEGGAARLWWLLRHFGHDQVTVLDGGLRGWREEGGELRSGPEDVEPGDFRARPPADDPASAEELAAAGAAGSGPPRRPRARALPRRGRADRSGRGPHPRCREPALHGARARTAAFSRPTSCALASRLSASVR